MSAVCSLHKLQTRHFPHLLSVLVRSLSSRNDYPSKNSRSLLRILIFHCNLLPYSILISPSSKDQIDCCADRNGIRQICTSSQRSLKPDVSLQNREVQVCYLSYCEATESKNASFSLVISEMRVHRSSFFKKPEFCYYKFHGFQLNVTRLEYSGLRYVHTYIQQKLASLFLSRFNN